MSLGEDEAPVELAPWVTAALAAEVHAAADARDYGPLLDRVGAHLADLLAGIEPLDPRVVAALEGELADRDLDGLDAAVLARVEMAAARPPPLPAEVVAALGREAGEPLRPLGLAVSAAIEGLEAPPLSAALRAALAADVALDGDGAQLTEAVMARIERAVEEELAADAPALAYVGRELAAEAERMEAARVVSEVRAEVATIGPRIERELPAAVERRISPATPRRGYAPTGAGGARPRAWLSGGVRAAAVAMMAAAAAVVLYLRTPGGPVPSGLVPLDGPRGEVHVDEVQYDGTVTVIESDGIAVIWLADEVGS